MEQKIKELEDKVLFLERVVAILVAKHKIIIPIELAENDIKAVIGKKNKTANIIAVDYTENKAIEL